MILKKCMNKLSEFEFDENGDIEPTGFLGTCVNCYEDISPADTIVADAYFEADTNNDLQPVT